MQIISVGNTFVVPGQSFRRCVNLTDEQMPGVYTLCRSGQFWKLYYTAGATSQPVLVTDERVRQAMRALLEYHKGKCKNCIEAAPGRWSLCEEAEHLLAGS